MLQSRWPERTDMDPLPLVKFGYDILKEAYKFTHKRVGVQKRGPDDRLSLHLRDAEAWSGSIQLFGMARSLDTDEAAIEVTISSQPRKFSRPAEGASTVSEADLLTTPNSWVILGDPGSGKTTIVKRLLRAVMLHESVGPGDNHALPLRILGRNIRPGTDIFDILFSEIGFFLVPPQINTQVEGEIWKKESIGIIRLAVINALQDARVVLFVDGVDEINPDCRKQFEEDIERINNGMQSGKIIMTCRSGDWVSAMPDFDICEICSLSADEIEKIVSIWADNPRNFVKAIDNIPYKDILDRPLFLTMLIIVFNQTHVLPESAIEVYYKVAYLLIEKWDAQRKVGRVSRYDGFHAERRFRFLCSLSYALMKDLRTGRFTSLAFRDVFEKIGPRFDFRPWQSDEVIQEIESHTGILVESGFGHFEFCHLTVQEFLAATHLLSLPGSEQKAIEMLAVSPATVAVAVCASGDPTDYLAAVVFECDRYSAEKGTTLYNIGGIRPFVARLRLERPILVPTARLGMALLMLISLYDNMSQRYIDDAEASELFEEIDFLINTGVARESLLKLKSKYVVSVGKNGIVSLSFNYVTMTELNCPASSTLSFSARIVKILNSQPLLNRVVAGWIHPDRH